MSDPAYNDLRVLDLSTNIAGPLAAMTLGDLGAEVVKVERPPFGDDTRHLPPRAGDFSTVFLSVNRNKKSIKLDYRDGPGRRALEALVSTTDVIVESFPPGVASKVGLTFDDFAKVNPSAVVCSISAFGDGPIGSLMPGYDALVQAVSGIMSFTGHSESPTVRVAPSIIDVSTGMWATIGILSALERRRHSGRGEHVQSALIDSAFALMCHQVTGFFATGEDPVKLGSGAPSAVPYRVYCALDGEFILATASQPQFRRLCESLDCPELLSDERFASMEARIQNRDVLDGKLESMFAGQTVDHWLELLSGAGISVGRVNRVSEAVDLPVVRERQLFHNYELPGSAKTLPIVRMPVGAEGLDASIPPPILGQHTEEILRGLDLDPADIDALLER